MLLVNYKSIEQLVTTEEDTYYCVAENIAGRVSSMIAELDDTGETLFVTGFMETVPNHTLEVTR